ncbi:phosphonate ABC transporter, permease protein PhnE [Bradyrhizobium sp. WSM2254]|uniref:phosphonate ABC transporter, permease protein PhnE n=1 Tax=Bradyrhizobium sp. WSM2254 TaxID=1188263 RepID=UPI0006764F99|nr:phosphonate ABC transporter, permease protein PhnE [Bradyrhizobium sp. WSM2254]
MIGHPETDPPDRFTEFARSCRTERRRLQLLTLLYGGMFATLLIGSARLSQVSPAELARGLPDAWRYVASTFPTLHPFSIASDLHAWYWNLASWLLLLTETALMSFMGTTVGSCAALLLCFPASRNLMTNPVIYFVVRRLLELARTVPDLVYAMIFVFAFGIGPLAGVLALSVHTTGALGKLFSEVNESVDRGPIESLTAAGATWPMLIRLAVLPQVLPNYVSYALLRFEYNIRSAAVFGIVGAGGIGEQLYLSIRQFDYHDISAIALLIIALVMTADLTCEAIRHHLIGSNGLRRD